MAGKGIAMFAKNPFTRLGSIHGRSGIKSGVNRVGMFADS
jgi:hypothetical protein